MRIKSNLADRLFNQISPEPNTGCWLWLGTINNKGYGMVSIYDPIKKHLHKKLAHRLSFQSFVGDIPDGALILHSCDNPICINPRHLRVGGHKENSQDMVDRDRVQRGERHCFAKLKEIDIPIIRRSKSSHTELAKQYGVNRTAIRQIRQGKTWKHV